MSPSPATGNLHTGLPQGAQPEEWFHTLLARPRSLSDLGISG